MRVTSLTDLKLRKLKPNAHQRVDIWDSRLPGFGVRIAPSGTKTFVLMYRLQGRKRRISLGRYPETSLADARALALQKRAQFARGESQIEHRQSDDLVFDLVLTDFLELHCKRFNKPSTQRSVRQLLENECLGPWRNRSVNKITRSDVIAVLDAMVRRGSGGAANNAHAAISKFFSWCASRDLVEVSPCLGVERPTKRNSRDRVLDDCELRALWGVIDTFSVSAKTTPSVIRCSKLRELVFIRIARTVWKLAGSAPSNATGCNMSKPAGLAALR